MLFSGAEQEKSVGSLSGGEKHRLMLSRLMLERGNLLVLDEPNNHLDLEAIIALGEALYKFGNNIICVSHDREHMLYFISKGFYKLRVVGTFVITSRYQHNVALHGLDGL